MLLIALGVFALSAPLMIGRWSLAILGIPLLALSVTSLAPRCAEASAYLPSVLAMLAGNLLLLSSALVVSGLLILLFAILVVDGLSKILTVWRRPPSERLPASSTRSSISHARRCFGTSAASSAGSRRSASSSAPISRPPAGGCSWRRSQLKRPIRSPSRRPPTQTPGSACLRTRPSRGCVPRPTARRDGARCRSHVDADARGRVSRDPSRPDADIGYLARHRFAVRCDRRRYSDDAGIRDAGCPALAPAVETVHQACGALAWSLHLGAMAGSVRRESRGRLADRRLARKPLRLRHAAARSARLAAVPHSFSSCASVCR